MSLLLNEDQIIEGEIYSCHAFNIGRFINLSEILEKFSEGQRLFGYRRSPKATRQFFKELELIGLEKTTPAEEIFNQSSFSSKAVLLPHYRIAVDSSGAISVRQIISFKSTLNDLIKLSDYLYDNPLLLKRAREISADFAKGFNSFIKEADDYTDYEDYLIFWCKSPILENAEEVLLGDFKTASSVAQVLRCEAEPLSKSQIKDSLLLNISYYQQDLVIVDWAASLVWGSNMQDSIDIIETVNLISEKLNWFEDKLDSILAGFRTQLQQKRSLKKVLWEIIRINTSFTEQLGKIKSRAEVMGDYYYSKLFQLVDKRTYLSETLESNVNAKLKEIAELVSTTSNIVQEQTDIRLTWAITILIAVEILIMLFHG